MTLRILLLEVTELSAEHFVIGKDVVAFGYGQPVACPYQQGIGTGNGFCCFLYRCHINKLLQG